jgi:hypothetical protein
MIDVSDPESYIARERNLVRIRCGAERCRHDDWYSEAEFEGTGLPASIPAPIPEYSKTHWYDILTSDV